MVGNQPFVRLRSQKQQQQTLRWKSVVAPVVPSERFTKDRLTIDMCANYALKVVK